MNSPSPIRGRAIAIALLFAVAVFGIGSAAYANPVSPVGKPSAVSNVAACGLTIGTSFHFSPGAGDSFQVNVSISGGANCTYIVRDMPSWIDATNRTSSSFLVTVHPNWTVQRSETFTVAAAIRQGDTTTEIGVNYVISVVQGAGSCSYSFDKTSLNLSGNQSITDGFLWVTASDPHCHRNAASNVSWITIVSGNNADDSGPIEYQVAYNPGLPRTGKITLGNATYTVNQGDGCSYSFGQTGKNVGSGGGTGAIDVTASSSSCPRNATPDVGWITITGGNNSAGSGPVTFSVAPNPGLARTGQIKLDLATYTVMQAAGCNYTFSPSIFNFQAGNGASSIQVTASSSACSWFPSSSASWVKITNAKQVVGNGTINFTVDPNPGANRTATITVEGNTATINQFGANCSIAISPGSQNFGAGGGEVNVTVTASSASCPWSAVASSPFISIVSGASGVGNGVTKLKVQPNNGAARSGSAQIAGNTFGVTQDGANAQSLAIIDLSPGFAAKGSKDFFLVVKGMNFTNACKVRWNGSDRQTLFINSSTLSATISANDIGAEGVFNVTVSNPSSGAESSAEQFMVYGAVANVSSASFKGDALAPNSLVSAFGLDLATQLKISDTKPLPTELAGSSVTITDAASKEHKASLFFVSPGQVNYLMPEGVAPGSATVMARSSSGHTSAGTVEIAAVAPGLFTANASGQGLAAAVALRVKANGQQVYELVAQYDAGSGAFVGKPIDLTVAGEQVYLIFYGTGLRYRSSLGAVSLEMGGVFANALYADLAPGFVGLDQVNVLAPKALAGRGLVDVVLTVDGKKANTVKLMFK